MLPTITLVTVRFFIINKLSKHFHNEIMNMIRFSVAVSLWPWFNAHYTNRTTFLYLLDFLPFYQSIKKSTNLHCSIVIATCICQTNPIYSSWIWPIDAIGFYFNRSVASIFVSKQVFQLSWIFLLQMPPHPSNTFHRCILHDIDALLCQKSKIHSHDATFATTNLTLYSGSKSCT